MVHFNQAENPAMTNDTAANSIRQGGRNQHGGWACRTCQAEFSGASPDGVPATTFEFIVPNSASPNPAAVETAVRCAAHSRAGAFGENTEGDLRYLR